MSKVAVVYWSSTGNTEAMANAIAEGAKMSGVDTEINDGLMANEAPNDADLANCKALGASLN